MKSLDHLAGSGLYAVTKTAGNLAPFAMIPNVNNRLILVAGERYGSGADSATVLAVPCSRLLYEKFLYCFIQVN
jgi:hypothetical protein